MTTESNRKITLKSRPDGYPELSDFELVEEPIPQPREGGGTHSLNLAVA